MSRFLLVMFLMSPAIAADPEVDAMHKAYLNAGWRPAMSEDGPVVCISPENSLRADRLVSMIAEKAKNPVCS